MGSRVTPWPLRGVAPLSPTWRYDNLDDSLSSYDTEGGLPGELVPTDPLATARLRLLGTAQTETLTLTGVPTREASQGGVAYLRESEAIQDLRGWDPPNVLSRVFRPVELGDASASGNEIVTIPSSQHVVISDKQHGPIVVWSPVTQAIVAGTGSPAYYGYGLWVRGRGGVAGADRVYSRGENGISYSDDGCITWSDIPVKYWNLAVDTRVIALPGGALIEYGQDVYRISDDEGQSWAVFSALSLDTDEGAACALDTGEWLEIRIGGAGLLTAYRLVPGTASDQVPAGAGVAVHTTFAADAVTVAQDADGIVWLIAKADGDDRIDVFYSTDRGGSWLRAQCGLWHSRSSVVMTPVGLTFAGGSGWLLLDDPSGGRGTYLCQLGGWSNIVHSTSVSGETPADLGPDDVRALFVGPRSAMTGGPVVASMAACVDSETWIGNADPDTYGSGRYTASGTGVDTYPADDCAMVVTTTAQTFRRRHTAGASTITYGYLRGTFENQSGGSLTTPLYSIAISDGSTYFSEVTVGATATQIRFNDRSTGSLTTLTTVTVGGEIEVWIVLWRDSGGDVVAQCAYREKGTTKWTIAYAGVLADDPTPPSNSRIDFGSSTSGTAVRRYVSCEWALFAAGTPPGFDPVRSGRWLGDTSTTNYVREAPVFGRAVSGLPVPLGDGLPSVVGGGRVRMGDTWTAAPRYAHGIERLFPEIVASPSRGWRSGTQGDQDLVITTPNARWLGSYSLAIGLLNTNVRGVRLDVWTGAAWSTLATYDTAITGLSWTRTGDMIEVDTGQSSTAWPRINLADFVGCDFYLNSTTVRRVVECWAGEWTPSATARPVLRLEGITGAEAGSGTAGALVPRNAVLIAHKIETPRTRYRIRILSVSPTLPDGRHRIGKLPVCGFIPFGRPHSGGWSYSHDPAAIDDTDALGNDERQYLGVLRRSLTVNWETLIEDNLVGSSKAPDYLAPDGAGKALIAKNDVAGMLRGVFEISRGFADPVLVLPAVAGTQYHVIRNPKHVFYGRCMSGLTITNNAGNDDDDTTDHLRTGDGLSSTVSPLTFREIL